MWKQSVHNYIGILIEIVDYNLDKDITRLRHVFVVFDNIVFINVC